ncbi:MAG: alpha/beta hydrolase [Amycolatopsis sp.]|uniref:alpha/beta fold hydrolase n=1 Tax=Amycolatopsis sp. TaxID=37632 RepID=UPI00260FF012|nr:alpha/beta hydrolase [Amycolatopsis sp.]MCU1682182.1 alpha/beta hydrolase [Amycolatopsis sp.]
MPAFSSYDGTKLAYHVSGEGTPVVCLPGGPMQDSAYLGDLGGLPERVRLIVLDHRGTGESATPAETSSYQCDYLVEDVEALREHLGLDRLNLLGHSAGANIAVSYAACYPQRIDKLLLVTPSTEAVDIVVDIHERRGVGRLREGEPWFAPAVEAFERLNSGRAMDGDEAAIAPFFYGRWDAAAQAHYAAGAQQRNAEAAAIFGRQGAFDPEATCAALSTFRWPVLVLGGEYDMNSPVDAVAEYAELFRNATLALQPEAGHFPWLDDPAAFTETIASFLG